MPNLGFPSLGGIKARDRFRQFRIRLPATQTSGMSAPFGSGSSMFSATMTGSKLGSPGGNLQTAQPLPFPPALFQSASSSAADVKRQREMNDLYESMFKQIIDAVEFGFNTFRQTAVLAGVMINGPTAMGGRLQGPALDNLIKMAPSVAGWTGGKAAVRDAVAAGLHQQWMILLTRMTVPGLPWFPAFAMFPGPAAPPMPNVPTPILALMGDPAPVQAAPLKTAMQACMRGNFDYSNEFLESIAVGFDAAMQVWRTAQMVTVLGSGPIPTFAPPYVPAGPVVGGSVAAIPAIST